MLLYTLCNKGRWVKKKMKTLNNSKKVLIVCTRPETLIFILTISIIWTLIFIFVKFPEKKGQKQFNKMDLGDNEELREALLGRDGDDDLEFYITFPTPTALASSASDDEGFDLAFAQDGSPEPLVFLLGWAGCDDRHLSKYSKIYEERGCITIRYSAPGEYILFDPEKIRPLASKLLDLVSEMSLESSPIFFHCFSNSGATVYQYMAEAMINDQQYEGMADRVLGQVYDSAPGRRTSSSFIGAFSYVWPGKNFFLRFLVPRMMLLYAIFISIFKVVTSLFTGKKIPPSCYDYILQEKTVRSLLFIYSAADSVFPAADIDDIASARDSSGCDVTRLCYEDSHHVGHLKRHRETYISAVDLFVRKCLERGNKVEKEPAQIDL